MLTNEKLKNAVNKKLISNVERKLILKYNQRLNSNGVPIIYNLRHLRKLLKITKKEQDKYFGLDKHKSYRTFTISKKSGGVRTIEAPINELKTIQTWIKENILEKITISNFATGFKKKSNIVENATIHTKKDLIINIDLKDFFPSITYKQVFRIFSYLGYNNQVSHLLAKLCTNSKNVLPQGAPSSPILSNIVCLKLDKRLGKLSSCYDASYSRYADDITFSGSKSLKSILKKVETIVIEEGFTINEKKVRFSFKHQRQEVTGLIVNNNLAVHPKLIKEINNAIYYCSKYGVVSHMRRINCDKSFYKEHLFGLAYFIKMVDEEKGNRFLTNLDKVKWTY